MAETRKIAAILAADAVGFSRMASADEDRTLAGLRALRADLIDPTVAGQNGRVFKRTGDGVLIEFRSVVEAVRCAIAVQNAMIERNVGMPTDQRIEFRVGIHLGDVVEESDADLMGDGVNIAARLEGIAKPGAICLSEDAYRQVSGRLDMKVTDLGPTSLKNIGRPIRVYSLQVGAAAEPPVGKAEPRATAKLSVRLAIAVGVVALLIVLLGNAWHMLSASMAAKEDSQNAAPEVTVSLVVLPFVNNSGDASQDYLADALSDDLTTYVSRISGTFVIARNTAFTYKGKPTDAKQIGRDLGVRYVLEGSVRPTAVRIRVNAQLIDAESGAHLWAETFDEERADLLQMEDDIVTRLARSLDIQLTAAESIRAARIRPENPDAQDLALRCRAGLNNNPTAFQDSVKDAYFESCENALHLDPRNVIALNLLAQRLSATLATGRSIDPAGDLNRMDELVIRALSIDPNDSEAHANKADLLWLRGQIEEGIVEAERSIELNPSNMRAYVEICGLNNGGGHPAKTLEYADKAIRLSPRNPFIFQFFVQESWAFLILGQDEATLTWADRAFSMSPSYPSAFRFKMVALVNLGRVDEARETYKHFEALPGKQIRTIAEFRAFASGRVWPAKDSTSVAAKERLMEGMRKAGMPEE
jgi:adenylate cyclase